MIAVFDLDHTLLDTDRLAKKLAAITDVDEKVFFRTYAGSKDEKSCYNFDCHLELMIKKGYIERNRIKEIKTLLSKVLKNIDDFLYPEAEKILKKIKDSGHELWLLTYGNIEWHKEKIKNLAITGLFDKIILTDSEKEKKLLYLKKEMEAEVFVFINDNADELLRIGSIFGFKNLILVKGKYSNNAIHSMKPCELGDVAEKLLLMQNDKLLMQNANLKMQNDNEKFKINDHD
jgi:FMN phosphatase YigB (HAD superfamily)